MDNEDNNKLINNWTPNNMNRNDNNLDTRRGGDDVGLTDRLTEILVEILEGQEDNVLQWLQALDMQVMGACRSDEILKPLLKSNGPACVAHDTLLAHLSQHFEPSEVAMLARCLCVPLVSISVGKVDKQVTRLCPTNTRGKLTLTLLPTSNMRLSFIGDDGYIERLATVSSNSSCSSVEIEAIPADRSGRSFVIRTTSCENLYFWCSEKSKLLGDELIDKLTNLLKKKPSLAKLTGISESRLGCFATRLRSNRGGSTVNQNQTGSVLSATLQSDLLDAQSASLSSKSCPRHYGNPTGKPNTFCIGSLSPRASSFELRVPRNLSSLAFRNKSWGLGESHLSLVDYVSGALQTNLEQTDANQVNLTEFRKNLSSLASSFLDSLGKSIELPSVSTSASISPYYCWYPPVASTLQYAVAPLQLPISSTDSFSLPPLSSLISSSMPSSLLAHESPLELSEIPSLDFPPFLPDQRKLPLSMASAQQIATFTPLMCDPIVHIPVIDICLSSPGCIVSAGPAISTTVPSLLPALVNPLIPASDSIIESSARETLRLLISSSIQTNSQLISVLPSVLTSDAGTRSILGTGSRALYEEAGDGPIANSIAAMNLVTLSENSGKSNSVFNRCLSQGDMVDQLEKRSSGGGSGGTCFDGEGRGGLID